MRSYDVISADDHIFEPPGLFDSLPKGLRALAPRPVKTDKGDGWQITPDEPPLLMGTSVRAGKTPDDVYRTVTTFDNMELGACDPGARLVDMDKDGIDAQVLYPQLMRHGLRKCPNADVRAAVARAYNTWIAGFDHFDADRFAGLAVLPPLSDGDDVVEILREANGLGLRGAWLTMAEDVVPLHWPDYEGFWAAAAELTIPISLHVDPLTSAFGRAVPKEYRIQGFSETAITLAGVGLGEQLCQLVFGGLFDRYRNLQVVLAESGVGWIPYVLERMDDVSERLRGGAGMRNERPPSEIAREQIFATFERDTIGMMTRHFWGVDNIMWASDYPHMTSTFPDSQRIIGQLFDGVPADEKQKITCDTARRLYRFSDA